ncbi:MAG: hypothetical protein AABO58_09295 [Acidobacteriota bacterium]
MIREAEATAVHEAIAARKQGGFPEKVAWEARSRYLHTLYSEFRTLADDIEGKVVFISYSVQSGEIYFKHMEELLRQSGFTVVTGFRSHPGDKSNVIKRVRAQIGRSAVYLGILTKEMQVRLSNVKRGRHREDEYRWTPSVWTMEEKGMALALDKPLVLMVENGIHDDFWLKTAPESIHHKFDRESYIDVAEAVHEAIVQRYIESGLKRGAIR